MIFTTETTEIKTGTNSWSKLKIEIFQIDDVLAPVEEGATGTKIGEYERTYSSLYKTFHPFQRDGKWYALYSKDYSKVSVMELPSCKEIAINDDSFCPVEFYVPSYDNMKSEEDNDEWNNQYKDVEGTFGFVSGCYWGDDSSWKIAYLDLSDMLNGNIKLEHKFGYIQQPPDLSLEECISMEDYAPSYKLPGVGNDDKTYSDQIINIAHGYNFHLDHEYLVGYPMPIEGKSKEEIDKLPLYNGVDLNQLTQEELIKLILTQEKTINKQRTKKA
jgi:hypothetical protein